MMRVIFSTFAMVLLISGCSLLGDDDSDDFTFEANIQDKNFEGDAASEFSDGVLTVSGRSGEQLNAEIIRFSAAEFEGEGTFPIFDTSYFQFIGGDVISSFGSSRDTTGTATITSFDASSDIIEGDFQFEITAKRDFSDLEAGDLFTITGRFRSEIGRSN